MANHSLFYRLRGQLRAFSAESGGNVMMLFALATIPLVAFVGAAVDYSRGNSDKAAMQAALDATALMLSKTAGTLTQQQINNQATTYFNALFTRKDVSNLMVEANYTSSNSQIMLTASGTVPTTFMRAIGKSYMDISTSTTVTWGNSRLRIALVLDNTGSMADAGKITALKTATNNLLTQLQGAVSQNGDVYVSIIPFVKDVNVGPANDTANWIDWTDWDNQNGTCTGATASDEYHCGKCSNTTYKTGSTCKAAGKVWTPKIWTPHNHNTWNGCVTDRGLAGTADAPSAGPSPLNTDTNVTAPIVAVVDTLIPAEQYSPCPQAAMALSYNWAGMTTEVNNMTPGGNTNQAVGLELGWMSLVGGGPFPPPPPMDPNYKYQQVIILLTDGLNTQDRWYTDQASIDNRQQMTCNNINAAKITLYTVQVNTDGEATSTLLQNCAGSPGTYPDSKKFFLLTSANEIITTFQQIGTALTSLRVAK
jgi:Flp pilus assembly protein TadG